MEYILTIGMMLGLRVAVGRQASPLAKPELTVEDFYQASVSELLVVCRNGIRLFFVHHFFLVFRIFQKQTNVQWTKIRQKLCLKFHGPPTTSTASRDGMG